MSKRLEILEQKYNAIYDEIAGVDGRIDDLNERQSREYRSILEKYLEKHYAYDLIIHAKEVKIVKKGGTYPLLNLYLHDRWEDEGRVFDKIDFSTSSFRTEFGATDMKWATEQFECLAFYSRILNDFADDIIAEFNTVNERYTKLITALYDLRSPLKKDASEVSKMMDKVEDENMMEKLMSDDGLLVQELEDDKYLPRFQVKFDWELNSVKSIRGLSKTASGKSVDLEVSVRRGYGNDTTLETVKIDRVRFDNVKAFIDRNKKRIV